MRSNRFVGRLFMIAAIFVACSRVSWGAEINIVSPSEAADVEGNEFPTGGGSARVQLLYPAADFMSLPESHRTIVGLSWRPDQSNTFTDPISGPARFLLSTTAADELNNVFANNVGDDETLVFEGTLTWQTDDTGPGPRDFDFVVPFNEPFTYDPSQGKNLLVEFVAPVDWDNVGNWKADRQSTDKTTLVATNTPSASVATVSRSSLMVTQFTFVPEPSTLLLTLVALGVVGWWRQRKHT